MCIGKIFTYFIKYAPQFNMLPVTWISSNIFMEKYEKIMIHLLKVSEFN